MTTFTHVPESSIKDRFKPVEIKLDPWPYFFSSAKKILSEATSANGKTTYKVQFVGNQVREIAEDQLGPLKDTVLATYKTEKAEQYARVQPISSSDTSDESDVEHLAISRKRPLTTDSEEDSEDEFEFVATPRATARGRQVSKPRSYQEDFKHLNKLPKVYRSAAQSTFTIPLYKNTSFIQHHATICFNCKQSGNCNSQEEVQIGKEEKRQRLLLCHHCSLSTHNNCIANLRMIDRASGRMKCGKCQLSHKCCGCQKSMLASDDQWEDETKSEKGVAFRCSTCFRGFHRSCVLKNVSPSLAKDHQDLVELYQSGLCMECSAFQNRTPQSIVSERSESKAGPEVLIKWKGESFRHTTWVLKDWICASSPTLYRGYEKRKAEKGIPAVSDEWCIVDRILNVEWEDKAQTKASRILAVFKDTDYAEAVWDEPPSEDETEAYTEYKNALERYRLASKVQAAKGMDSLIKNVRKAATSEGYEKHALKEQPDFIQNGTLMKHQMEALNWLIYQWEKKQSCILADDMGLGKTIQIISFLYSLFKKFDIFPFLIVVPNSTATNWIREFAKWAPEMVVAPFFGYNAARDLALTHEILDKNKRIRCHVVVATYESILDPSPLHNAFWPVLIVDESQRLKNDESQLFRTLHSFHIDHTVLLTGTPLQNNLRELFNIMHFIHPKEFHGIEADNYEDMTAAQVEELHTRLRPHFLRRTKEEVLKKLPPKYELIVPVSMTPLQKEVYKQCISREIHETLAMTSGYKRQKGLSSIFTNLRKNLNHPYLLDGVEKPQPSPDLTQKNMIDACAKLKLFHQIFPKLKQKGHRILIFSTMTRALDVLEDYFHYEHILYTRIDGSTRERERVRNIDAFNAPNSKLDVFLLSTRAGGVGINLTTADTVIIWDSDFNPYADLQAISRAHRIGQTKMVLIYRLMTRLTIEEKVLQIGKKKMALEHVVVERMKADDEEKLEDIESILKYGTEALFADDDSKDIVYDEAAIDNLLNREQYRQVATEQQQKEIEASEEESKRENGGMNFSFAQVWQVDGTIKELDENQADEEKESDFWQKFLKEQQAAAEKKKEEQKIAEANLGRGARKRAQIVYTEKPGLDQPKPGKQGKQKEHDDEYVYVEEPMVIDVLELDELEDGEPGTPYNPPTSDQTRLPYAPTQHQPPVPQENLMHSFSTAQKIPTHKQAHTPSQTSSMPSTSSFQPPLAHPAPGTPTITFNIQTPADHNHAPTAPPPPPPVPIALPNLPPQYKIHKLDQLYLISRKYVQAFQKFYSEEYKHNETPFARVHSAFQEAFSCFITEVNTTFVAEAAQERQIESNYGYPHVIIDHLYMQKQQALSVALGEMIQYMEAEMNVFTLKKLREKYTKDMEIEEQKVRRDYQDKLGKLMKEQESQRSALLAEEASAQCKIRAHYTKLMPTIQPLPLPPTIAQQRNAEAQNSMKHLADHLRKEFK
ncbi:P-loop containing nucleoside triphosphate hydrolase protein [Choanephora cucurbitarum]|nr:P-loop containing nucleoside triphosphate hydrolase protein [Choanephora cucurbitarum]